MKTAMALLLGLCAGRIIADWTAALDSLLGIAGGVAAVTLYTSRHAQSERAQQTYRESLVSAGWHMASKGTPETTALRVALPPKAP